MDFTDFQLPSFAQDPKARQASQIMIASRAQNVCIDATPNEIAELASQYDLNLFQTMLYYTLERMVKKNGKRGFVLTEPNRLSAAVGQVLLTLQADYPIQIYAVCRSAQPFSYTHRRLRKSCIAQQYVNLARSAGGAYGLYKTACPPALYGRHLAQCCASLAACCGSEPGPVNQAVRRAFVQAGAYPSDLVSLYLRNE